VGKHLSLGIGCFRLLMPLLFNCDFVAHGSLPDVLKAGCWAKFAPTKLANVASGSIAKNEIRTPGPRIFPAGAGLAVRRPGLSGNTLEPADETRTRGLRRLVQGAPNRPTIQAALGSLNVRAPGHTARGLRAGFFIYSTVRPICIFRPSNRTAKINMPFAESTEPAGLISAMRCALAMS
jgi:hypothetical protein